MDTRATRTASKSMFSIGLRRCPDLIDRFQFFRLGG
jgi:hypothetical protein